MRSTLNLLEVLKTLDGCSESNALLFCIKSAGRCLVLSLRAQEYDAREDKGRKDWLLRDRATARNLPKELHICVLETVDILHAIEVMIESADS